MVNTICFFFIAFGFCEYTSPEVALRCMRILNNFKLGDKMLLVSQLSHAFYFIRKLGQNLVPKVPYCWTSFY